MSLLVSNCCPLDKNRQEMKNAEEEVVFGQKAVERDNWSRVKVRNAKKTRGNGAVGRKEKEKQKIQMTGEKQLTRQ